VPPPVDNLDPSNPRLLYPARMCIPNCISIGSSVFAQFTPEPNTDRHRPHYTWNSCSNRPHLCSACSRCGPV